MALSESTSGNSIGEFKINLRLICLKYFYFFFLNQALKNNELHENMTDGIHSIVRVPIENQALKLIENNEKGKHKKNITSI